MRGRPAPPRSPPPPLHPSPVPSQVPAAGRRLQGRPQLLARRQLSLGKRGAHPAGPPPGLCVPAASSPPWFSVPSGASRLAPAVTQHAPFFKGTAVVHGEFKELSLDDFKGKYLVLFFYPLDL